MENNFDRVKKSLTGLANCIDGLIEHAKHQEKRISELEQKLKNKEG